MNKQVKRKEVFDDVQVITKKTKRTSITFEGSIPLITLNSKKYEKNCSEEEDQDFYEGKYESMDLSNDSLELKSKETNRKDCFSLIFCYKGEYQIKNNNRNKLRGDHPFFS